MAQRQPAELAAQLSEAGCVAADEEAIELLAAADEQNVDVDLMVARRVTGEPLAWITGKTMFCNLEVRVDVGVYVPRWQTEALALRAAELLPEHGVAIDFCTGTGAIAAVLLAHHPHAMVMATDIDRVAVTCARSNGVDARYGDLDEWLPTEFHGAVDVITACPPYVPEDEMHLLPRDTLEFEPQVAIQGGPGGTRTIQRAIQLAPLWLKLGGRLLLEIGGNQRGVVSDLLANDGFVVEGVLQDDDGDDRAIIGRYSRSS